MPDLKKYWQEIRAIEKSLPAEVWLVSLQNLAKGQVGGSMAEAGSAVAAKLLHAKSQRLATEEELIALVGASRAKLILEHFQQQADEIQSGQGFN